MCEWNSIEIRRILPYSCIDICASETNYCDNFRALSLYFLMKMYRSLYVPLTQARLPKVFFLFLKSTSIFKSV